MAENEEMPLPPKLDLRKKGLVPSGDAPAPDADVSEAKPVPKPETAGPAAAGETAAAPQPKPPASTPGTKADAGKMRAAGPLRPRVAAARKPGEAESGPQPTVRVSRPGSPGGGTQPKTIRISIPSASGEPAEPKAAEAPAAGSPQASPQTQSAPATVRVTRPGGSSGQPQAVSPSPIPLDKLSSAGKADEPKTIRLKRPADGFTSAKTVAASAPAGGEGDADDASEQPTRKKTIKVKRPERSDRRAKPMTIARSGEAPKRPAGALSENHAAGGGGKGSLEEREGAGGVFAILCGLAAVCVCGVIVYLFAAQGHPEWGISWPGMIIE